MSSKVKFKPFVPKKKKEHKLYKDMYVLTCDMKQKDTIKLGSTDIVLQIQRKNNPDHRETHPNVGTIVSASDGAQFKAGDKVICKHFTFEGDKFNNKSFYTTEDGEQLFMAHTFDIMYKIDGEELIPREGILLCEDVQGKFLETELQVLSEYEGGRRDIAKILKVWEGCTEYKAGEYVMLKYGADYRFNFNGKTYIRVDHYFNDTFAITDSPETYDSVVHKHVDHYKGTDSINKRGY